MSVMITGGSGKLGRELIKLYLNSFHPSHKELDIIDEDATLKYIEKNKPDTIIHCAALTGIKQCEENKDLAWKINVKGTENLVRACKKFKPDCYFLYISTACVFHGDTGNYTENDLPYPKNFYSLTKLLGEFVIRHSDMKKWLIIRTNFVARDNWPYPKAFVDRWGTYLFADDLANAIKEVLTMNMKGVIHICGDKKFSMFELARITTPDIQPMTMAEYLGVPLTQDMTLKSIKIKPFKMTL